MLTPRQIELIKATVPVLREHGVALTSHFYKRMLNGNSELKNVFNQSHQRSAVSRRRSPARFSRTLKTSKTRAFSSAPSSTLLQSTARSASALSTIRLSASTSLPRFAKFSAKPQLMN